MKNSRTLFALLLVVAIDGMGLGFVFPVITPLFMHAGIHGILPAQMSHTARDIIYGIVVALYPLCMFFGAPVLGEISDKLGRKKVLTMCLVGTGLGYIISGIGISLNSLSLLILGRIIDGLTAGSLPLAQAAIADLSNDKNQQAKNMGMMMFAIAGGQVIGPFIGGMLSDNHLFSFLGPSIAFYFGCLLAIINIIWLLLAFEETYTVNNQHRINLLRFFKSFAEVFHSKKLLALAKVFFCMQLSWSLYFQAISAFLDARLHYSHFMIGLFAAILGIVLGIAGTFILPRVLKLFSIEKTTITALSIMAIGSLGAGIITAGLWQWFWMIIMVVGAAMAFPCLITSFSSLVDETRQGWVNGLTGAVLAIAWTVTAVLAGLFMAISFVLPMLVAGIVAIVAVFFMKKYVIMNAS